MPDLTLGLRSDGKVLAAGRHSEVLHTLEAVRAIACFGTRRQIFVMSDGTLRIHIRGSEFLPETVEGVRLFTPTPKHSILDRYTVGAPAHRTAKRVQGIFAVGLAHTLTLGQGGAITATGAGDSGQLDLKAHGTALQLAAGHYHSAAILADGRIVLSGKNTYGQSDARAINRELDSVGLSTDESRGGAASVTSEPDPTLLPYAWRQVACGLNHTAAIRSDGRVYAIGQNPDGRCDTRKWRDVIHLSCGLRHTVAVTAKGDCVASGDNRYGQCDTSRWKQITMAAAGEYHTVGLRADGRVEAAGDNRKGQCHVEDLRDIISVACLPEATLCVTAEGRVIIRGGSGQHDKAIEALREVVAIHTCEHRIAALTVDRRVILIP
jgi:alpha-tubulin suppressor-like RCC1 family protein